MRGISDGPERLTSRVGAPPGRMGALSWPAALSFFTASVHPQDDGSWQPCGYL